MDMAARTLLGLNDFAAFCKRREGGDDDPDVASIRLGTGRGRHPRRDGRGGRFLPLDGPRPGRRGRPGRDGAREVTFPAEVQRRGIRDPRVKVMPAHGLSLGEVRYPPDDDLAARADEARTSSRTARATTG